MSWRIMVTCYECGGDGRETCTNPDHTRENKNGDMVRVNFNFCCPVCGYSENGKVPNGGTCSVCNGTGAISAEVNT